MIQNNDFMYKVKNLQAGYVIVTDSGEVFMIVKTGESHEKKNKCLVNLADGSISKNHMFSTYLDMEKFFYKGCVSDGFIVSDVGVHKKYTHIARIYTKEEWLLRL